MKGRWFIRIWADGEYFDLWHVNHLLAGILCAGAVIFFQMNLWVGLLFSIITMLGWEVYEVFKRIGETPFNKVMDVVFGIAGFFILYSTSGLMDRTYFLSLSLVSLVGWVALELWGLFAWRNGASEL